MKTCKHQWFEIKKLSKAINASKYWSTKRKETDVPFEQGADFWTEPNTFGILLKCIKCKNQQELWET